MNESSLVKKLAHVMKQVKYIQKRGRNAHFGYTYATEADVAEKVREVLADQNVIMLPSVVGHQFRETTTAKGKTEYICTVDMEFIFYDGDSGETLTVKMSGDGQDGGDKAIFKAISGCTKYAQMKSFMIPTGDDPEDDNTESGRQEKPTTTDAPGTQVKDDKANMRSEIKKMLWAMSGHDPEEAIALLEHFTSFEGKNGKVAGKTDVAKIGDKQLPITYDKIKKAFAEWKKTHE